MGRKPPSALAKGVRQPTKKAVAAMPKRPPGILPQVMSFSTRWTAAKASASNNKTCQCSKRLPVVPAP
eukprot:11956400-Karenia_brevis.AAC.1